VDNHDEPATRDDQSKRLNKPNRASTGKHGQRGEPLYTQGVGGSIPSPPITGFAPPG